MTWPEISTALTIVALLLHIIYHTSKLSTTYKS